MKRVVNWLRTLPSTRRGPCTTMHSNPCSAARRSCGRCCRRQRWRREMAIVGPVQQDNMGAPQSRIDGRAKVTGAAPYASDYPVGRPAYAYLVTSAIARGRIDGFDLTTAKDVSGLLDILTYETMRGQVKK